MGIPGGQVADLLQFLVGEDRRGHLELVGGFRIGLEEVALRADRHLGGGDDLLADRVDRRVRHLGEELFEVRIEQLGPLRQDGQGDVVAHRPDRFRAGHGHRVDQHPHVFGGVAEYFLAA